MKLRDGDVGKLNYILLTFFLNYLVDKLNWNFFLEIFDIYKVLKLR